MVVYNLLLSLIEKCEVGLRKDATGWDFSARGALGVITLLIIVVLVARIFERVGVARGQDAREKTRLRKKQ